MAKAMTLEAIQEELRAGGHDPNRLMGSPRMGAPSETMAEKLLRLREERSRPAPAPEPEPKPEPTPEPDPEPTPAPTGGGSGGGSGGSGGHEEPADDGGSSGGGGGYSGGGSREPTTRITRSSTGRVTHVDGVAVKHGGIVCEVGRGGRLCAGGREDD